MKKRSILAKMLITYTIIIAVSFTVLATLLSIWFKNYYIEYAKEQLINKTSPIYNLIESYADGKIKEAELVENLEVISYYFQGSICIITKESKVIISTDKHNQKVNKKELANKLKNKDFEKFLDKEKNTVYRLDNGIYMNIIESPVYDSADEYFGKLIMFIDTTQTTKELYKIYLIIWILAMVAIIFASITIYVFTQKNILVPLLNINDAAKRLAKGDVSQRVVIKSDDEVGELSKSFNYMAESLEKIDENRRQFISNVSHEIRTPITSIKGFISGMVDEVIPTKNHKKYLEITLQEIERLTRLINGLLDLSALQSGAFSQQLKDVDIIKIIKLTLYNFERNIKDKNLNFSLDLESDCIMVLGDEDRLIQVMTNLLDNAIKYSNIGGTVRVHCNRKQNKVYICIFNSGEGIEDSDINKIWERFYRVDKARSSKNSSGLGLSIVREIISNLNEDIWVENVNDGIRFTFTLTQVKS